MRTRGLTALLLAAPFALAVASPAGACGGSASNDAAASTILAQAGPPPIPGAPTPPSLPGGGVNVFPATPQPGTGLPIQPSTSNLPSGMTDATKDATQNATKDAAMDAAKKNLPGTKALPGQ